MKGQIGQVAQGLSLVTPQTVICWIYRNGSWWEREEEEGRERENLLVSVSENGAFKLLIGELVRLVGSQQVRRVDNTIHWQVKMRPN